MYYKFVFPHKKPAVISVKNLLSFSYTEISNEPSLIHSHPYTEIIIPNRSTGIIVCGQNSILTKNDSLYIIPPNCPHTERNTPDAHSAFKYFVVKIKNISFSHSEKKEDYIQLPLNYAENKELHLYLELASGYLAKTPVNEKMLTLNVQAFYQKLLEIIEKSNVYNIHSHIEIPTTSLVQQAEYYISKNYDQDISIKDLSKQCGTSQSNLLKQFHKTIGISPKQYLLKTRIQNAQYLLITTDHTISHIGNACGFVSHAYFSSVFFRFTGKSPSDYRKEHQ